jgi:NADH-quinone oxidoreductase subunit M
MNYALLGFFIDNAESLQGGILILISHGFSSSALFFLIGFLYDRFHSRLLFYFSGLLQIMPLFACSFFFFTLANFGFPGSANFLGELLILLNILALSDFFYLLLF